MKKFFSLLALVGVLAACQKEDLKTAFKVDPGVATVHATALSIDGSDITADVTFSFNGEVGSTSQTFYSTEYEAFDQEVIVSAVWAGYDGKRNFTKDAKVRVHVLPGGKADYNVTLTLGEYKDDEFSYSTDDYPIEEGYKFFFLTESHSGAVSHAATFVYHDGTEVDGKYLMNPTEFVLRGVVNYEEVYGNQVVNTLSWNSGVEPLDIFNNYYDAVTGDPLEKTPASFNITVSAFAMYCAYQAVGYQLREADFIRTNNLGASEVIARFTYNNYCSNEVGCVENACIGHEAHYVPGHGHEDPSHSHGHGTSNAGGGIVFAD